MLVSRKCLVKRPIVELIEELKAKLDLLEGDRASYYENSFVEMQQNKEKISSLRREVHDLRMSYYEKLSKDEAVISQAFQNRPIEKSAFIKKSYEVAIEECDFRVSAAMKRYNMTKHITRTKEAKLENLKIELKDASYDLAQKEEKTPQMQRIRDLENRVDKLELKSTECEFIQKTYTAIFKRLYDEQAHCNQTLDEMEADIMRCRAENTELKKLEAEAVMQRDRTQRELRQHEQFELADKKRRDIETTRMRRVVEEEKEASEQNERRTLTVTTTAMSTNSKDTATEESTLMMDDRTVPDQPDTIEENIERLRAVTGTPDLKLMVKKFKEQLQTKERLVGLINSMEEKILDLRQECIDMEEEQDAVKIGKDSTKSKVDKIVCNKNRYVEKVVKQDVLISDKACEVASYLSLAKSGYEHLLEKLTHVKLADRDPLLKPTSPEAYLAELFDMVKAKLIILMQGMKKYDLDDFESRMKHEQTLILISRDDIEGRFRAKMPMYNDRVSKPAGDVRSNASDIDSGPEDPDFRNRLMMKQESAQFIEMRLKRRNRKRKNRR